MGILVERVYRHHMLFVWLWFPKFARSATRCLGIAVGLPVGMRCAPPSQHNGDDQFLLHCFNSCRENILTLCNQFEMTTQQTEEIMCRSPMSKKDCSMFLLSDMRVEFPALDKFLFLKFDGLCLANHYQEGLFSSKNTTMRQNYSNDRLDNQMQLKHNDLQSFRSTRVAKVNEELQANGRTSTYRSAITTRQQCVQAGRQYLEHARTSLVSENFEHEDCPKNKQSQKVRDKQVTESQRQRAEETVDIYESWSLGAGREDKDDEEWLTPS